VEAGPSGTGLGARWDSISVAQHPIPQQAPQFLRLVWLWSWLTTLEESLVETGPDTVSTVRALPEHWWR